MKLRKLGNKGISTAAAVLIAVIFLGVLGGGLFYGYTTGWKWQVAPPPPSDHPPPGSTTGSFTIQAFAYDSLASTTTRAVATDLLIYYYQDVSGVWSQLAAATVSTWSSVTLSGDEGGFIYAVVSTSASYYLDVSKTVAANNMMTYVGYENVVLAQALPQYVFKINMNGMVPGNRATADLSLSFYAITYAAFTFAAAPTNVTGVGLTLNTTYLGWFMTAPAVSEGMFVRQITLSTNDTSTATQTLYRQNIPAVGFLNGGTFTVNPQASAIVYTWNAPTNAMTGAIDLGSCVAWSYGTGSINKFDLTTALQTTLTAGLREQWIITVYWLTPAGSGASVSTYMQLATTT